MAFSKNIKHSFPKINKQFPKYSFMEEWKEYKISEVIEEIAMGPFGSNIKVDNFIDFGIPVLNGSNLQGFILNETSFNYVSSTQRNRP